MKIKALFSSSMVLLLVSCGINSERALRYTTLKSYLNKQQPKEALKHLKTKEKDYSEREQLLLYFDKGILNFYAKNYKECIQFLDIADDLQDKYYTESVSANVGSFLLNDNVKKYKGADHELIYINVLKALCYLELEEYESAMVEVRKGQEKQQILQNRYQDELETMKKEAAEEDGGEMANVEMGDYNITDSGVLRLLGLILYRIDDETDDSRIDKEKLQAIWSDYPQLYDFETPKLDKIATELDPKFALVDVFALEGQNPQLLAWDIDVMCSGGALIFSSSIPGRDLAMEAIPVGTNTNFNFAISVPFLSDNSSRTRSIKLYLNGKLHRVMKTVEKVSNLAQNDFQVKKTYMIIKSALRAFGKALAAKIASDEIGERTSPMAGLLTGLATQMLVSASEVADTRSWNLLHDGLHFAELKLPKGKHSVRIDYIDHTGSVFHSETKQLDITDTQEPKTIITYAF